MAMWLIVIIAVGWLVVLALVLGLCAAAKRGDEALGYEPRDEWRDGV